MKTSNYHTTIILILKQIGEQIKTKLKNKKVTYHVLNYVLIITVEDNMIRKEYYLYLEQNKLNKFRLYNDQVCTEQSISDPQSITKILEIIENEHS